MLDVGNLDIVKRETSDKSVEAETQSTVMRAELPAKIPITPMVGVSE